MNVKEVCNAKKTQPGLSAAQSTFEPILDKHECRVLSLYEQAQYDRGVNGAESGLNESTVFIWQLFTRIKNTQNIKNKPGMSTTSDSSVQNSGMTA
jgi:hypothetical protein